MKQTSIRLALVTFAGAALVFGCAKKVTQQPVPTPTPDETPIAQLPTPVPTLAPKSYVVQRGDSLWNISSKPETLGDNFRWPLLFKANRDQIIDPDLIEPAQDLTWKDSYTLEEISDAVGKAKETPPYAPHAKPRKQLPLKY